ncbi:hypothetical protein [Achromobacter sp. Marseille-Q4962]|uniref:hypothetical protein n=1 Tax=Achromobacter sp. Marseille-Q4962 TaxID=2942202 RepID=UPI00207387DC|nr:hypothetical protein [Achromobacter sp. Marseille-Q4962]
MMRIVRVGDLPQDQGWPRGCCNHAGQRSTGTRNRFDDGLSIKSIDNWQLQVSGN